MAIFSLIGSIVGSLVAGIGAIGTSVAGALGGLGAGGLTGAAGIVGAGLSAFGAIQQAKGAKRAEALRQRQMNLQAARERRTTIRQSIIQRSQALNAAAASGVQGSGIEGGLGSIQSQTASNVQGINQGQELGNSMFSANRTISSGQTLSSIGAGVSSFGDFVTNNFGMMRRQGIFA
jgi:hypothetical protein